MTRRTFLAAITAALAGCARRPGVVAEVSCLDEPQPFRFFYSFKADVDQHGSHTTESNLKGFAEIDRQWGKEVEESARRGECLVQTKWVIEAGAGGHVFCTREGWRFSNRHAVPENWQERIQQPK